MNLLLKAKGVKQVDRNYILGCPVPEATESYTPISNQLIIETALEELEKNGFSFQSEFYKHSTDTKFVGGLVLTHPDIKFGYDLEFAFKNSYDKSMSVGIGLGTSVFICSNSCVNAEFVIKRMHTGEAEDVVIEYIKESVKGLYDNYVTLTSELERWKEIDVTKRLCAEVIGRLMLEEKIISPRQFAVIRDEFDVESFNYGVQNTLYNLYQACTHSLKNEPPLSFIDTHVRLHTFFSENFN